MLDDAGERVAFSALVECNGQRRAEFTVQTTTGGDVSGRGVGIPLVWLEP